MRTCDVLEQLEPRLLEILITANGCADGTIEFVSFCIAGHEVDYECARAGLGRFADWTMCEALLAMDAGPMGE